MNEAEWIGRTTETDCRRKDRQRRYLPSLGSFATFEVAAKHLSFTLAAGELHVSQAAVSQHIRGLGKALDCQLFVRKRNGMELTAQGQIVLDSVTQGLDRLSDGIFQIGQATDSKVITVSDTYAGVSHFVKPITDAFRQKRPDIRFTLLASDEDVRLPGFEEVDVAVNLPLNARRSYYLRIEAGSRDNPHVQAFVNYLLEKIRRLPAFHD
ncbi:MAG: LysR family transcriptional regulator [Sphingomonadaceae bacterium]|nr:LysR family transcriptional regulator [Sphingomonadaceae bacterium]